MTAKHKKKVVLDNEDPDLEEIPPVKAKKWTPKSLEEKYQRSSSRLIQERGDYLLPQVVDLVKSKKWVNIRPEYQRRIRWDNKRKSLLIESLLVNIPIPPVFLYEGELGRYEVMDGQQRLSSIVDFYSNDFELSGLKIWPELNGLRYSKCPVPIKRGLDRRRISSVVLLTESSGPRDEYGNDIRLQVFGRLNTGGAHLNPQEIRNATFNGSFNNLIVELAGADAFTKMWDIPAHSKNVKADGTVSAALRDNPLYSSMADCQIVLRFFAFRDRSLIKGSVRKMLDNCMIRNRNVPNDAIVGFRSDFLSRLQFVRKLFGADAFKLPVHPNTLSRPLFDGLMVAADGLWEERGNLLKAKRKIQANFSNFVSRPSNYRLIVAKANTADAVKRRIAVIRRYLLQQI